MWSMKNYFLHLFMHQTGGGMKYGSSLLFIFVSIPKVFFYI
jgi:hypothetical protein